MTLWSTFEKLFMTENSSICNFFFIQNRLLNIQNDSHRFRRLLITLTENFQRLWSTRERAFITSKMFNSLWLTSNESDLTFEKLFMTQDSSLHDFFLTINRLSNIPNDSHRLRKLFITLTNLKRLETAV